ncbi:hypothetical protein MGI18_15610 [Bacillus sp. OVS6]|nr:hypothetical protein MGI18_15610 [Bacillus sp. OVS6]
MNIEPNLTQKELQEILTSSYKKCHELENINVIDLIEDIKRQLQLALKGNNESFRR